MDTTRQPPHRSEHAHESTPNQTPDWISFLFLLGKELEQIRQGGRKPCAILVVPTIEFTALLIAAGIIYQSIAQTPSAPLDQAILKFEGLIGRAVRFPRMIKGKKRQLTGILEKIEFSGGNPRLVIKYRERPGPNMLICQAFVQSEDFPLVVPEGSNVQILNRQRGQQLADDLDGLKQLVGCTSTTSLLSSRTTTCWIIDTKRRLTSELEVPLTINRVKPTPDVSEETSFLLKDIVRPDFANWPAVAASSRSHIDTGPPSAATWISTISVGTLSFLRHFPILKSDIRVSIISPTMSAYDDAISHAARLFEQRAETEVLIPDELLFAKPASFDIQIWEMP
jgi:hypothetical protein